jgi:hemoglobin-like flavoprotein
MGVSYLVRPPVRHPVMLLVANTAIRRVILDGGVTILGNSRAATGRVKCITEGVESAMTTDQMKLVQESFAHVVPIVEPAAALFYARLFELDPQLRHLFRGDMAEQGRKLMQMLAVAVRSLGELEAVVPAVQALGRRHAGYGVSVAQYATVADALLGTLEQALGGAFTSDVRDAWVEVYSLLANTMQQASEESQLKAA